MSEAVEDNAVENEDSTQYKNRYTVGIYKKNGYEYYQDFFETNDYKEAENKCIDKACDEETRCIVYDRKAHGNPIIFRHDARIIKDTEDVKPIQPAKYTQRRSRKVSRTS